MRWIAVLAATAAAAASAPLDAAATPSTGFHRVRALEPAATYVARKPVRAWCTKTYLGWDAYMHRVMGDSPVPNGLATAGADDLYVAPLECDNLLFATRTASVAAILPALAGPIETLTHEAIHLRGEADEAVTDCAAMRTMGAVAVRYFHVTRGAELKKLMTAAWAYHRSGRAVYTTIC